MKKRLTSMLVALAIFLTAIPASAFYVEDKPSALAEAPKAEQYYRPLH